MYALVKSSPRVFPTEKFEFLECRRSRLSQFDIMFRHVFMVYQFSLDNSLLQFFKIFK